MIEEGEKASKSLNEVPLKKTAFWSINVTDFLRYICFESHEYTFNSCPPFPALSPPPPPPLPPIPSRFPMRMGPPSAALLDSIAVVMGTFRL